MTTPLMYHNYMILHRFKSFAWWAERLFCRVGKDFLSVCIDAVTERIFVDTMI